MRLPPVIIPKRTRPTMQRTTFLPTVALALCAAAIQSPARAQMSPQRELLPEQQIQQVLNRVGFGPRPGDVAKVRAMGVDKWIDMQLQPERIDDAQADALMAHYPPLS